MAPNTVLFVCVENACRSLMAEAMFNVDPPPGWTATSAGTKPAARANPRTSSMLGEIGLVAPAHAPQLLTREMVDSAGVRVTMGCLGDVSCPARLKGAELRDWSLPDPAALDDAEFRQVRDRIAALVRGLCTELGAADPAARKRLRSVPR